MTAKNRFRYDHALWMRLYREGLYDAEIARRTGAAASSVYEWRQSQRLQANDGRSLTPGQVRARIRLHEQGLTDREIADRLDINAMAITRFLRRRGIASNKPSRTSRLAQDRSAYPSAQERPT